MYTVCVCAVMCTHIHVYVGMQATHASSNQTDSWGSKSCSLWAHPSLSMCACVHACTAGKLNAADHHD